MYVDTYLRIEKSKKHVAKGRLFTLGFFSSQLRCTAVGVGSSYIKYIYVTVVCLGNVKADIIAIVALIRIKVVVMS